MPSTKPPKARTRQIQTVSRLLTEYLALEQQHEDLMDALDKIWYRLSAPDRKWLDKRGNLS